MFVKGQVVYIKKDPPNHDGWMSFASLRSHTEGFTFTFSHTEEPPSYDPNKKIKIRCNKVGAKNSMSYYFYAEQLEVSEPRKPPTIPSVVVTKGVIHEEDVSSS